MRRDSCDPSRIARATLPACLPGVLFRSLNDPQQPLQGCSAVLKQSVPSKTQNVADVRDHPLGGADASAGVRHPLDFRREVLQEGDDLAYGHVDREAASQSPG